MKKFHFFVAALIFLLTSIIFSQNENNIEPNAFGGNGYVRGEGGDGVYQYLQGGLMFKSDNDLIGPFLLGVNVNMNFDGYHYTAKEIALGGTYSAWGKISDNYDGYYWLSPSLKYFSDYGYGGPKTDVWQKDLGFYGVFGANATSKSDGWFNSYKIILSYQQTFLSEKTGLVENGNIAEKIDFKATNKSYVKLQFESAVKRLPVGSKARFEPKAVVGYLYDAGSTKSYLEFGFGIAVAFTKEARYYEAFALQYRARFDSQFTTSRLDVIEVNLDFVNLWKLLE